MIHGCLKAAPLPANGGRVSPRLAAAVAALLKPRRFGAASGLHSQRLHPNMERNTKLLLAKAAVLLGAIPVLIFADATGPDPGLAGVPNEAGTCAACHASGTSSINTKGGSVTVALPNGN